MDYATTTAIFSAFVGQATQLIVYVLGIVLGIGASFFGLKFGLRWLKRYAK